MKPGDIIVETIEDDNSIIHAFKKSYNMYYLVISYAPISHIAKVVLLKDCDPSLGYRWKSGEVSLIYIGSEEEADCKILLATR
jgi:hypothetical protein